MGHKKTRNNPTRDGEIHVFWASCIKTSSIWYQATVMRITDWKPDLQFRIKIPFQPKLQQTRLWLSCISISCGLLACTIHFSRCQLMALRKRSTNLNEATFRTQPTIDVLCHIKVRAPTHPSHHQFTIPYVIIYISQFSYISKWTLHFLIAFRTV